MPPEFIGRTRVFSVINRRIAAKELKVLYPDGYFLGDGKFSRQLIAVARQRETNRLIRAAKHARKKGKK